MADSKQFRNLTEYHNGTTAESNIKLLDIAPFQHEDVASNTNKLGRMNFAQSLCEPVAICDSNDPSGGAYTATCVNYPDFAVTYDDSHGASHYLYGLKVRVIFTHGITYGSVASGTFPTLSINGSAALPLLAQGKAMASGSVVAGQSVEFTIIPYGNTIAFDADSNVRESTSSYIRYSDGSEFAKKGVIVASNTTITNAPPLDTNDVIRVYFDANISGSNTSTAMSLSYNGTSYNVKVGKNGSLANFVASEISSGTYRYLQKYTTLELLFDGTQFVIVGNPVVLSSADYTIYADGLRRVNSVENGNKNIVTSNAVFQSINSLPYIRELTGNSYTSFISIPRGVYSIGTSVYSNFTDKPSGLEGRIIFIAGAYATVSDEQICLLATARGGKLYLGYCYGGTPRYDWRQII